MTAEDWKRKSVWNESIVMLVHKDRRQGGRCSYLEVLSDFTDKTLEGKLPDEELSGLLVLADFTESDSSGTETMRLLDTTLYVLIEVNANRSVSEFDACEVLKGAVSEGRKEYARWSKWKCEVSVVRLPDGAV